MVARVAHPFPSAFPARSRNVGRREAALPLLQLPAETRRVYHRHDAVEPDELPESTIVFKEMWC